MTTPIARNASWHPWRTPLAWLLGLIISLGLEFLMGPIGLWQLGSNNIGAFVGFGICAMPVCAGLAWCVQVCAPRLGPEHSTEEGP